jgi:lipopolysaccharide export system permease protein
MKIFFRYLFMRLLQPFCYCLAAFTVLWIMADLYGTMEDFLDHKIKILLILHFYALQIPRMFVQVLPASILFSTLFTLLALNRRSELVALQSGGMAPLLMYSPFFLFGALCMLGLAYDLSGPAAKAEVTRERLLKEVKGQGVGANVSVLLPYIDKINHRIWFFSKLDASGDRGKAEGLRIVQQDAEGHDMDVYVAKQARWTGNFWRLTGAHKIVYDSDGNVETQKDYEELDLPDLTTPPRQLSLIISEPEQLTLSQLAEYISTSTQTEEHLAGYRTEWWYRVLYPLSVMILMLYGLLQGSRSDRRSPVAGIGISIAVLVAFTFLTGIFMAAGRNNRLPPIVAVSFTEFLFAGVALHLLAKNNGWYWQLREEWTKWRLDPGNDAIREAVAYTLAPLHLSFWRKTRKKSEWGR